MAEPTVIPFIIIPIFFFIFIICGISCCCHNYYNRRYGYYSYWEFVWLRSAFGYSPPVGPQAPQVIPGTYQYNPSPTVVIATSPMATTTYMPPVNPYYATGQVTAYPQQQVYVAQPGTYVMPQATTGYAQPVYQQF